MEKKFYVYIHYRLDDDSPFYIGKGTGYRDTKVSGRNAWWMNIVSKHGYRSEKIAFFEKESNAYLNEQYLITSLRMLGANLCNLSCGGDGSASGVKRTTQTKQLMSKAQVGIPHPERRGKKSASFKGVVYATNLITGETIQIEGSLHMISIGFDPSSVSRCLKGKVKSHKKYTFSR